MLRVFGEYVRFRKNIGHAGTKLEQWEVVAFLQVVGVIRFSESKRWCVFLQINIIHFWKFEISCEFRMARFLSLHRAFSIGKNARRNLFI